MLFVTGTGTGVGKTIVTGALLRALRGRGINAASMKPVQTGALLLDDVWRAPDLDMHLEAAPLRVDAALYELMCPYCYEPACSPHLAGRLAGNYPDIATILESACALAEQFEFLLIEGAGGLLAPVDEERTMLDLIKAMGCPALVVAATGLGTINHSLLTLQALQGAGVPIAGMVFNQCVPVEDALIEQDNPSKVAAMGNATVHGVLRYREEDPLPWDAWAAECGIDSILEALA